MTIRIIIADDQRMLVDGLTALFARNEGIEVVGTAGDGREAVALVRAKHPDVVVMDVSMPNLNGVEAARQIATESSETRILALTMHHQRCFVAAMMRAGVAGYLLKDCAHEELVRAVEAVHDGHTYLSQPIADMVYHAFAGSLDDEEDDSPLEDLTSREREVLQLIAEGNTTKGIAAELYISTKTVESHRAKLMAKLGIDSIAGLTRFALSEGLTTLES